MSVPGANEHRGLVHFFAVLALRPTRRRKIVVPSNSCALEKTTLCPSIKSTLLSFPRRYCCRQRGKRGEATRTTISPPSLTPPFSSRRYKNENTKSKSLQTPRMKKEEKKITTAWKCLRLPPSASVLLSTHHCSKDTHSLGRRKNESRRWLG